MSSLLVQLLHISWSLFVPWLMTFGLAVLATYISPGSLVATAVSTSQQHARVLANELGFHSWFLRLSFAYTGSAVRLAQRLCLRPSHIHGISDVQVLAAIRDGDFLKADVRVAAAVILSENTTS